MEETRPGARYAWGLLPETTQSTDAMPNREEAGELARTMRAVMVFAGIVAMTGAITSNTGTEALMAG